MGYDKWGLHALMEFAFRFLPIWCHARWCRCSHCEQKHQAIKLYWANTNNQDKAYQVMVAVYRKAALLHVLTSGWWFCESSNRSDVQVRQLGPLARQELANESSLSAKYLRLMTTSLEVPRNSDDPVNLYVSNSVWSCILHKSHCIAYVHVGYIFA
jgi:hypothetical protein